MLVKQGLKVAEREDELMSSHDVGNSGFQVVMGWLMNTHQNTNPGNVICCQAL